MNARMDHPFPKSVTVRERCKRLLAVVHPDDNLAIMINADPDAMASAMALKRFFWRRVRKVSVYHVNPIKRADNLALIKYLKVDQHHVRHLKAKQITKWAIVDSQPGHHELFKDRPFDIIMDHHPVVPSSRADFVDIREKYGAMSTLMTEYLRAARIRPSTRLATALFYGIKTDTDNFVRESLPNDINAFRYLYKYANMNIIKKIESSEMTQKTLAGYQLAMERLSLLKGTAFVYMGEVGNPDVLVMIADFFMRMAEVTWSIAAGTYNKKVIVIVRNAGLHGDAGKIAKRWFEHWGASAGGHRSAARAEIGVEQIPSDLKGGSRVERLILKALREGP